MTAPSSPMMNSPRIRSSLTLHGSVLATALLGAALMSGCSGGGGGGGASIGSPGTLVDKPGGGMFFVDDNQGGTASRLLLTEMFWGRVVDVHDIDGFGDVDPTPALRDFVIAESVVSDGTNYRLETNPITQKTRLVILREQGAPNLGNGTFDSLLEQAGQGLPGVPPKNDDGTSLAPFPLLARNAAIVLKFNDVLDDSDANERVLAEMVRVKVGYPPVTPFGARIFFDDNYGTLLGGEFHSTRVIVDLTVSEAEAATLPLPVAVNSVGLPASRLDQPEPNVSLRLPTLEDFGGGQFNILSTINGAPLRAADGEPEDASAATRDVVRALRAGNGNDLNNGFLTDLNPPEIVGGWPMRVDTAVDDPAGTSGFDFIVDFTFDTVCRATPEEGDILQIGDNFLEAVGVSSAPNGAGTVSSLRLRNLGELPITTPASLLGVGLFLSTYDPAEPIPQGCWISFTPQPGSFPATDVETGVRVLARFSEPMDPSSLTPFENFSVIRGDGNTNIIATNIVVGQIEPSGDLRQFTLTPDLPLAHTTTQPTVYSVRLNDVTDLAGNGLRNPLQPVDFTIDPAQPTVANGGTVMRFQEPDELVPLGLTDLRGQFFFDIDRGLIRPRPVSFQSVPADRTNPVPSIMVPFPPGVQTPLSPLGSRLQTVWRYVDLGWQVRDETKYNVDVYGLNWAPVGGQVINDFYEEFEIALSHSRRQPDEDISNNLLPRFGNSGLVGRNNFFSDNILNDPRALQKVVHPRELGYQINPVDRFASVTGTLLMPFPLNRDPNRDPVTYTWRDTAALNRSGPAGAGIPLAIEVGPPLSLEAAPGAVAGPGQVPTFGLPLLMDIRCFPSSTAIGLNAFDISLAINSSAIPAFRSFSTGGVNQSGTIVTRDPELTLQPLGGFNPGSTPPGKATARANDNSFYVGLLEIVTRISRIHTIWIDTIFTSPDYLEPILLPPLSEQPSGTDIIFEYRGASDFSADVLLEDVAFNAARLDPYGEMFENIGGVINSFGNVVFHPGAEDWTTDINALDGARYMQIRISFVSNIESGLNAELSSFGFAYDQQ